MNESLIERLKVSCLGLDAVDPLRLLVDDVIAALTQPEQEPVATVTSETGADITMSWWHEPALPIGTKLFTHPPQRTWVGLTDEEIADEFYKFESAGAWYQFTRAIEAKLKQKNGFAEEENT